MTIRRRWKENICLGWGYMSQSTAMVMWRRSVHLTTLFPGQAWLSGKPVLCAQTFTCNKQQPFLYQRKEVNDCRNYFMIDLYKSMRPGRDQTRNPWLCSWTRYRMCYGAWWNADMLSFWRKKTGQRAERLVFYLKFCMRAICQNMYKARLESFQDNV